MNNDKRHLSSMTSVSDTWARIRSWLQDNVPSLDEAILPPVAPDVLAEAEEEIGVTLDDDTRGWWQQCDGVAPPEGPHPGHLLPGYDLYSVAAAMSHRRAWLQVRQEHSHMNREAFDLYVTGQERQPAGSPCGVWLATWVPIAGSGGGEHLFVDLRSGPLRGCVGNFDRVYGAPQPPIWSRVGEMLRELAVALEEQTSLWDMVPMVYDNELDWV